MRKAFDGQDIVDLYITALAEQPGITNYQIGYYVSNVDYTHLTGVTYSPNAGGFRFRMETDVFGKYPICQYVIVTADGEMKFKDKGQWFVHEFAFFNTFTEAHEYLKRGKECDLCGQWFVAVEEFLGDHSEGFPDDCPICRAATLKADKYLARQEKENEMKTAEALGW